MLKIERPWTRQPQEFTNWNKSNHLVQKLLAGYSGRSPLLGPIQCPTAQALYPSHLSGVALSLTKAVNTNVDMAMLESTGPRTFICFADVAYTSSARTAVGYGTVNFRNGSWSIRRSSMGWSYTTTQGQASSTIGLGIPSSAEINTPVFQMAGAIVTGSTTKTIQGIFNGNITGDEATFTPWAGSLAEPNFTLSIVVTRPFIEPILSLVFNGALTKEELMSLYRDPWQLFEPRRIWIPVSAPTGPTVTALTPTTVGSTSHRPRYTWTPA